MKTNKFSEQLKKTQNGSLTKDNERIEQKMKAHVAQLF